MCGESSGEAVLGSERGVVGAQIFKPIKDRINQSSPSFSSRPSWLVPVRVGQKKNDRTQQTIEPQQTHKFAPLPHAFDTFLTVSCPPDWSAQREDCALRVLTPWGLHQSPTKRRTMPSPRRRSSTKS
jgi:hypothetical protein